MKKQKKPFLLLGNSGKVYLSNKPKNIDMGTALCSECQQQKPFDEMRWNELHQVNLCKECREKNR